MGIVGGLVIAKRSYGLCRQAAKQLLDMVPSEDLARRIRDRIEASFAGASVVDLHLWDIGPSARACIVSVAAGSPAAPAAYRAAVASVASLQHVTVEVHPLTVGDTRVGPVSLRALAAVVVRAEAGAVPQVDVEAAHAVLRRTKMRARMLRLRLDGLRARRTFLTTTQSGR